MLVPLDGESANVVRRGMVCDRRQYLYACPRWFAFDDLPRFHDLECSRIGVVGWWEIGVSWSTEAPGSPRCHAHEPQQFSPSPSLNTRIPWALLFSNRVFLYITNLAKTTSDRSNS